MNQIEQARADAAIIDTTVAILNRRYRAARPDSLEDVCLELRLVAQSLRHIANANERQARQENAE